MRLPLRLGALALLLGLGLVLSGGCLMAQPSRPTGRGCPSLAGRTAPPPRDAVPEQLESGDWRQKVAALDATLAGIDRNRVRIAFIGDSITQYFDPPLWEQFYGHRQPLNLGISGDFLQGALWRLFGAPPGQGGAAQPANGGQWGRLSPQVAVLLLGTNNTQWGGSAEDVALGIAELVRQIHARSPRTRILLLGLLPRGADASEALRATNAAVNAIIARCADDRTVFYLDVGRLLLDAQGRLSSQISFDQLHLTSIGYAILATAIEPTIRRLLGD